MSNLQLDSEVVLGNRRSALQLLHALLAQAAREFPDALGQLPMAETAERFRAEYSEQLPQFEAARLASGERHAIARYLVDALAQQMAWRAGAEERPLAEWLAEPVPPLRLESHTFAAAPGWRPSIVYRGQRWEAGQLADLGELLVERSVATNAVAHALRWLDHEALDEGVLRLAQRKIAVLGAGAEMASTRAMSFSLRSFCRLAWTKRSRRQL